MKVLTLNCHSWQESDQENKIKYLAKTIKEGNYDVIALQEVSQHIDSKVIRDNIKEDNYMHVLLEELRKIGVDDYDSTWDFSHIGYDVYEEGIGLLSKHKIVEKDSFFVSKTTNTNNWKARKVVKATIIYEGEYIDFVSCHLGWWNDEEEPFKFQAEALNSKVNSMRRTFLMGDFNNNANIEGEGYSLLKSLGWKDTYSLAKKKDDGITVKGKIAGWDKNKETLRLDIIFTNMDCSINSSSVIFNGNNKEVVSDHYGVEVDIK